MAGMDSEKGPVHPTHMARSTVRPIPKTKRRPTFIRAYRTEAGLTLEQLAERVGITHASLSRIERGKQDYNQTLLEALATELKTDAASLLMRDPTDPEGIWSIWDHAKQGQREQIVAHAKLILKTGT